MLGDETYLGFQGGQGFKGFGVPGEQLVDVRDQNFHLGYEFYETFGNEDDAEILAAGGPGGNGSGNGLDDCRQACFARLYLLRDQAMSAWSAGAFKAIWEAERPISLMKCQYFLPEGASRHILPISSE